MILDHFAHGNCCQGLPDDKGDRAQNTSQACKENVESLLGPDVEPHSVLQGMRDELVVKWLISQEKKLAPIPMRQLLAILELDYDPDHNIHKLRHVLRKFITKLKRETSVRKKQNAATSRLEQLRSQWPQIVPQTLKDKLINLFREQTSSQSLASVTCAACAGSTLVSQSNKITVDNNLDLEMLKRPDRRHVPGSEATVDSVWLNSGTVPPPFIAPLLFAPDVIVDTAGVSTDEDGNHVLILCNGCRAAIRSKKVPPSALANHMMLGAVPDELKDLTVVEEAMIAKCRAKCWVIQLKEENRETSAANSQRGLKGHIIVYPQRPSTIATILPPSLDEISTPICVIFVGSSPPTAEWLRTKAKPLCVRREKVRKALVWLKQTLPEESTLLVHVEHVIPSAERDCLTSRYDTMPTARANKGGEQGCIPFNNVVITDVEGSAPSNELRAAAIRHMKKGRGGYIEIPHDATPVNEFFNPDLFPMIYPSLFPYGIGGFENSKRSVRVSMKRHTKHLFSLTDK